MLTILSLCLITIFGLKNINSKPTYYLPGVAPHNYRQYESVRIFENNLI